MSSEDKPVWKQHLELAATLITIAGALGAWLGGNRGHWASLIAIAAIVILFFLVLWTGQQLRVARTVTDVIEKYKSDEADIKKCKAEFGYLGVSGFTVLSPFKAAVEGNRGQSLHARMLFIHPDTLFVLENKRISEPHAKEADAKHASEMIRVHAREYLNMNQGGLRVEVRFYQACLHFWTYNLDQHEVIVGLRLAGATGYRSTALRLRNTRGDNKLFRVFHEQFEDLWNHKDTVDAATYLEAREAKGMTP